MRTRRRKPPVIVAHVQGNRSVFVGIRGGGHARLKPDEARQLAGALLALAGPASSSSSKGAHPVRT